MNLAKYIFPIFGGKQKRNNNVQNSLSNFGIFPQGSLRKCSMFTKEGVHISVHSCRSNCTYLSFSANGPECRLLTEVSRCKIFAAIFPLSVYKQPSRVLWGGGGGGGVCS